MAEFVCQRCGAAFSSEEELRRHQIEAHGGERPSGEDGPISQDTTRAGDRMRDAYTGQDGMSESSFRAGSLDQEAGDMGVGEAGLGGRVPGTHHESDQLGVAVGSDAAGGEPYTCEQCGARLRSEQDLARHTERSHRRSAA